MADRLTLMQQEADTPARGEKENAFVDCGWGRLIFANTFRDTATLVSTLRSEQDGQRDIAFYVDEPQMVLAGAPQSLFLDPSLCYRLDLSNHAPLSTDGLPFHIRPLKDEADVQGASNVYAARGMVPLPSSFNGSDGPVTLLVAEDNNSGEILGAVMGVDHVEAFGNATGGASLWSLAVAPSAPHGKVGEYLVRALADRFRALGRAYLDLTVMQDNAEASALYEKLGFVRVPVFSVKCRNRINERLYAGTNPAADLNPYGRIIVEEALRRGIHTEVIDAEGGFFKLTYGGRTVACRESLSEFTSAVAMSICDDKRVTRRIVEAAGVRVPRQITQADPEAIRAFLKDARKVVVKPARGEQGNGVSVGLSTPEQVQEAIARARTYCADVVVEEFHEGEDLRLVVIDYRVVAAALRRPPRVVGNGRDTIYELIKAQSRRRSAATGGESTIPVDAETEACLAENGHTLDDILPEGAEVMVRKAANLHTGGTIHDVTDQTHPQLIEAAIRAARAIDIPVTGIDLIVKSPTQPDYVFIEANERPGLANHEPQPTAERFIDLLFPLSIPAPKDAARDGLPAEKWSSLK